jgi:hypothetical protein
MAEKDSSIQQHETTRQVSLDDVATSKDWSHAQGKEGAQAEHDLTLWQAIKAYPGAITWSVLLSTAIIMEGEQTQPKATVSVPKLTSYMF